MVVFVPPGAPGDPTRRSEYYDETYEYLRHAGVAGLDASSHLDRS
jgi:hypothetical protein